MQLWRECSGVVARNLPSFPLIVAGCNDVVVSLYQWSLGDLEGDEHNVRWSLWKC